MTKFNEFQRVAIRGYPKAIDVDLDREPGERKPRP